MHKSWPIMYVLVYVSWQQFHNLIFCIFGQLFATCIKDKLVIFLLLDREWWHLFLISYNEISVIWVLASSSEHAISSFIKYRDLSKILEYISPPPLRPHNCLTLLFLNDSMSHQSLQCSRQWQDSYWCPTIQ